MSEENRDFLSLEVVDQKTEDSPSASSDRDGETRQNGSDLMDPGDQIDILEDLDLDVPADGQFDRHLQKVGWDELTPAALEIFQINLGKLCNMTCSHCHVDAGPQRTEENMDRETVEACLRAIDMTDVHTVDLTGGAPELNPHFEYIVEESVKRGKHVIDRCNLTILTVNRFKHLPQWFADRGVEVVCSLPHYRKFNTDAQRGEGTYRKSIEALHMLNDVGYGYGDPDRKLTLVTNPSGAYLAGNQESQEEEWKEALARNHDVYFDSLIAINNMPIARYLDWLIEKGQLQAYMERLVNAFNPGTVEGLMCRNTLSVSWDGRLYDCDFNQMLDIEIETPENRRPHVKDFDLEMLQQRTIQTGRHCYGCTAGSGSSCSGNIV